MPIGNVTVTVTDGALGVAPPDTSNLVVTMGVSSLGTPNTLYSLADIADISATLGTGPAVEAFALRVSIAGPGYFMPINASVAGSAGSVTATRAGSSTSVMSVSGTPKDAYDVKVVVTSSGTGQVVSTGACTVKVSFDGGATYSPDVTIPAGGSYAGYSSATGLTLVFTIAASATLDAGDVFSFTCKAPYYNSTDLGNAFAALLADARTWGLVHVVGYPTAGTSSQNATNAATMATAVGTQMASAATNYRYARAIVEAPPSTDAELISSFATFADVRVMVVAGTEVITSVLTGRQMTRSSAWTTVARLAKIPISESPGFVGGGALTGVISLVRDERKTPGLFDQRFSVHTTIIGAQGFYSDIGKVMAPSGSDFGLIMRGRVMDAACTAARAAALPFLNSKILVDKTTGRILEQEARTIEDDINAAVRAAVVAPSHASDSTVVVNRTDNILSTSDLRMKIRVTPVGYAGAIEEEIAFYNPALQPV